MNLPGLLQYILFLVVLIALVKPVGIYLFRVFNGDRTILDPLLHHTDIKANTLFFNIPSASAMLVGRFGLGVIALGLAGLFAQQRCKPESLGTLSINSPIVAALLIGVVLIVGALSYFPALALGPIIEHLLLTG